MKKLLAVILSVIMIFSCAAVPASAASDDNMDAVVEIGGNILEGLMDFLHEFVAGLFSIFGLDCPMCENHGMGDVELSDSEIIESFNNAVNNLKASQKAIKMTKSKTVSLTLDNFSGEEDIRPVLEKLLQRYESSNQEEFNFILGESSGGKLSDNIPPKNGAALNSSAIKSISMSKIAGRRIIRVKLKDGIASFNGVKTTNPAGYEGVINPIDFKTFDVRPLAVDKANISYTDVTVEATLDSDDRIVALNYSIPFVMTGTVSLVVVLKTDVDISGSIRETLTFEY